MSAFSDLLKASFPKDWSNRDVAREADRLGVRLSRATVDKYTKDDHGTPTEDTIRAFHQVLKIPLVDLREAAGVSAGEPEPWQPPVDADRLGKRQRRIVDELIRLLLAQQQDLDRQRGEHEQALQHAMLALSSKVAVTLTGTAELYEWVANHLDDEARPTFWERAEVATRPLLDGVYEYRDNLWALAAKRDATESAAWSQLDGILQTAERLRHRLESTRERRSKPTGPAADIAFPAETIGASDEPEPGLGSRLDEAAMRRLASEVNNRDDRGKEAGRP